METYTITGYTFRCINCRNEISSVELPKGRPVSEVTRYGLDCINCGCRGTVKIILI